MGKTQLAVEYVYRHRADHGLVWWIAFCSGDVDARVSGGWLIYDPVAFDAIVSPA